MIAKFIHVKSSIEMFFNLFFSIIIFVSTLNDDEVR